MTTSTSLLRGRDYAVPDDVRFVWRDVCSHRIVMSPKARLGGDTAESVLDEILEKTEIAE